MQEETLGAVKGKLSYGHAIFFFFNTIRCCATSKACAFNACLVGSTWLNAPSVVNWGDLMEKSPKRKMKLKAREFKVVLFRVF